MEGVFDNVKPKWKQLLFHNDLKPLLLDCFTAIEKRVGGDFELLRPHPLEIFKAFTYCDVDDIKVIILGQDPYPKIEDACGLSFMYRDRKNVTGSLSKIYEAVANNGYGRADISTWPEQGVLLLNKYLTRSASRIDGNKIHNGGSQEPNMHPFWDAFTTKLLQKLVNYFARHNKVVPILMWGDKAKVSLKGAECLYWGHPSGMSTYNQTDNPKNFKYCDHFRRTNEILARQGLGGIVWGVADRGKSPVPEPSPTPLTRVVAFTDGGCTANGKAHAVASYGVYFPKQFLDCDNHYDLSISGLISREVTPTNNRGELFAIITALEKILELSSLPPALIITDSEYSMNIINSWIHKWHKEDSKFSGRKNPDYLVRLYALLESMKSRYGGKLLQPAAQTQYKTKATLDIEWPYLTVIHQDAHGKTAPAQDPKIKTGGLQYEKFIGNSKVDSLCSAAMKK